MKNSRLIILLLALGLISGLVTACTSTEEEPVIDQPASVEEPEVTDEPVIDETAPVMVWSVLHDNKLHCVAVAPDGETVAVGEYKVTYVHELADGALVEVIVHDHAVEDLDFSFDGSILGAGQGYYGVLLSDIVNSTELMTLSHGHNSRLAFSPDGVHLATGDRSGIVWLWRLDDGKQVAVLEEPEVAEKAIQHRWVAAIEYHPSGKLLAATHTDDTVYIWDAEEERVVRTLQLQAHVSSNKLFRFSPDGTVMAGAVREDGDHLVRLWTVDEAEQLADLPVPEYVRDLAFSPDGSLLAVASHGSPLRKIPPATTIWDIPTRTLLYTLDQAFEASDSLEAVSFTPDGGHLAVARQDGTLELWRLPGADPLVARPRDIRQPPPLPSDVLFDAGSAKLKPAAYPELEELAEALHAEFSKAAITFIGHTTSYNEPGYNLKLSTDRANAVKAWFENWAGENGADGWVLLAEGRGCTELKVPDFDVEGNFLEAAGALNRRVEIKIEEVD